MLDVCTDQGREFVLSQPVLYDTPSSAYVGPNVMAELEQSMRSMYLESEAVFRPAHGSALLASCATTVNYQPRIGMFVDFLTATPMSCSVAEASKVVWQQTNAKMKIPDKTFETVSARFCAVIPSHSPPPCSIRSSHCCLTFSNATDNAR